MHVDDVLRVIEIVHFRFVWRLTSSKQKTTEKMKTLTAKTVDENSCLKSKAYEFLTPRSLSMVQGVHKKAWILIWIFVVQCAEHFKTGKRAMQRGKKVR
jgi:hypothetical protein